MQTVLFIHENHVDDRVVEKMLTDKKGKSPTRNAWRWGC